MTISWHGNAFRIIGPFCGESTVCEWRARNAERWCFLWSLSDQVDEQTVEMPGTHCKQLKNKSVTHFSSEGGKPLMARYSSSALLENHVCCFEWCYLVTENTLEGVDVSTFVSTACWGQHQRKYQSIALLVICAREEIHWWPVTSLHKGTVRRRAFHVINFLGVSLQTRSFQIRWVTMFHSNVNVTLNTFSPKQNVRHLQMHVLGWNSSYLIKSWSWFSKFQLIMN